MASAEAMGWQSADLSRNELSHLFAVLLARSKEAFGVDNDAALKASAVFADLWSRGRAEILKKISENALADDPQLSEDNAALQTQVLRRVGVEMGKLAMHFKHTKGRFSCLQSAAVFCYLTAALEALNLVSLTGSPAQSIDREELYQQAADFERALDVEGMRKALEAQTVPGLTAAQNESVRSYTVKQPNFFNSKVTIAFVAALILLVLFVM